MARRKNPQKSPRKKSPRAHLPDPKIAMGPYRPFTCDPGWNEAWWWLGIPLFVAAFTLGSFWANRRWYDRYVLPEGYGIIEISNFLIPLIGLWVAARLLFKPFVRARPFVFTVALIGAFSCLYIAGEEMSWGQHFFHWNTPEYWAEVNWQEETNLHNTYAIFEKAPRSLLEILVVLGGLLVPLVAVFDSRVRANRLSLFLPADALVPIALGAMVFKVIDRLQQGGHVFNVILDRPSETIETYLYVFIVAYLVVYARRISELEAAQGAAPK